MTLLAVGLHTQAVSIAAETERARATRTFVCDALQPRVADLSQAIETPEFEDEAAAAEELMRELAQRLVWNYADGLALHAAALEWNGRVVLCPATSGGGKTTLAVYLAMHGFRFLTDELVFVPLGTTQVHALARPAHLKPGSMFVIEQAPLRAAREVWVYGQGALIGPRAFGDLGERTPRELALVVFPHYATSAKAATVERLSPGAASYALTGALVNARNLPRLGVAECARLATCTPAFRLEYRELDAAEAAIRARL